MLAPDAIRRIEDTIRQAESRTAGEIVVALARRSSRYRSIPLLYGLVAALLIPWPLIWLTPLSAMRIFLLQAAVALVTVAVSAWPALRLRLVPPGLRRARAREAAQREFVSRGMAETRGRTGILLYVSEAERHAEVIGDVAIAGKVDEAEWRAIIESLVEAFGRGAHEEGLATAIAGIGAVLARHVPPDDDRDELPNRLVIL